MRKSGRFLAAVLSFALVLATPLSAQATKSGLSDAKSKKTALEAEKKKTEQELKNLEGHVKLMSPRLTVLYVCAALFAAAAFFFSSSACP